MAHELRKGTMCDAEEGVGRGKCPTSLKHFPIQLRSPPALGKQGAHEAQPGCCWPRAHARLRAVPSLETWRFPGSLWEGVGHTTHLFLPLFAPCGPTQGPWKAAAPALPAQHEPGGASSPVRKGLRR